MRATALQIGQRQRTRRLAVDIREAVLPRQLCGHQNLVATVH